jgi:hypothetical protein
MRRRTSTTKTARQSTALKRVIEEIVNKYRHSNRRKLLRAVIIATGTINFFGNKYNSHETKGATASDHVYCDGFESRPLADLTHFMGFLSPSRECRVP